MNKFIGCFNKVGLKLKKHSPEILVVAGVSGLVGAAVMACRATTKASAILEKYKEDYDAQKDLAADEGVEDYTDQDAAKDLRIIRVKTAVDLAVLYAPAIGVGAMSIACVLAGHGILRKRGLALSAAYATISQGFKEYRGRVVERFGADVDRELRYDITKFDITSTNEEGAETKETITAIGNVNENLTYARIFDKRSKCWENIHDYNMMFLKAQQTWANDKLRADGYIFLNDVYESLGIPRNKSGNIVGWVYNANKPNGDNYVDFGIFNVKKTRGGDNTGLVALDYEDSVLLDFNVDGDIWSLMSEEGGLKV